MKKLILLAICLLGFTFSSQAQSIADHALGLRLGDNNGLGTEISYQHGLSENNRLELDLGWRSHDNADAFKLTGLYQWVWNIDGGFNWYVGAGGGIGSVDIDNGDSDFFALVAGDVGIEYDFDIPLLISLDFRPEIGFVDYYDDLDFDIALGIRYQF
ncbi:hypothetical protein SAMN04488034_102364 [Salinimicrobium catena]|uniref:Outer membrane protein beta-barrel domain-containing protein n=1 Tax=Salinimicrobium catena TaxID=390640 RepID=A0A1H5LP96_9FLAO|nr:hypothetical protein [Salinimicrobium catena]SDL12384.1 hypothetical protein SAMN04488140_102364 [Salinimicrobium catena]SEE78839.1 hypothetical protein SAMN04488034_102364 [Salinimicrobium catena]